ncbi:MAG: hypothetical protein IJW59_05060 [Clostridia bacterium]|nr:hypothetical protein [Clostridia bacterium]
MAELTLAERYKQAVFAKQKNLLEKRDLKYANSGDKPSGKDYAKFLEQRTQKSAELSVIQNMSAEDLLSQGIAEYKSLNEKLLKKSEEQLKVASTQKEKNDLIEFISSIKDRLLLSDKEIAETLVNEEEMSACNTLCGLREESLTAALKTQYKLSSTSSRGLVKYDGLTNLTRLGQLTEEQFVTLVETALNDPQIKSKLRAEKMSDVINNIGVASFVASAGGVAAGLVGVIGTIISGCGVNPIIETIGAAGFLTAGVGIVSSFSLTALDKVVDKLKEAKIPSIDELLEKAGLAEKEEEKETM